MDQTTRTELAERPRTAYEKAHRATVERKRYAEHKDQAKHRMRAYGRALSALSREHKDEYQAHYRVERYTSRHHKAAQAAYRAVRAEHPEEFGMLYDAELAREDG